MKIILAILLAVFGLSTLIPGVPGTWLVVLTLLGFGFGSGFTALPMYLVVFGIAMMLLSEGLEYMVGAFGARRFGASKPGVIGAILGELVGIIVLGPIGIIIGPIVGAVLMELAARRPADTAVRAGFGAALGVLSGVVLKFIIVFASILFIIVKIF